MAHNIRYLCLSDLHLGEEDSLLTNLKTDSYTPDPREPSPVMRALVACLRHIIQGANRRTKPVLILCGDILELALTTVNQAAMAFERFLELTMEPGGELFSRMVYIPGNHDHHLWESAREIQYTSHIGSLGSGKPLPIPWHVTRMFPRKSSQLPQGFLLTTLAQRQAHLREKGFVVHVAYPNYGILSRDRQKCVVFHHGHFVDSLYSLMSVLKTLAFPEHEMPSHTWDLEEENYAWIDFFWSTLGLSGEFGQDVELIYEKMRDRESFKRFLSDFAARVGDRYDLPGWDWAAVKLLEKILHGVAAKAMETERNTRNRPLSDRGERGLLQYLERPLRAHILRELGGNMPLDVTFVFGHTHKPFQKDMRVTGYPGWVDVYNTGGWVVDTVEPEPLHGASVALVDEKQNATAIRLYSQRGKAEEYTVEVEEAKHAEEKDNPFHRKIRELVRPSEEPWRSFSEAAAAAVHSRAENLKCRIRTGR